MFPSVLKVRSTQQLQRVQTNTHTHVYMCMHTLNSDKQSEVAINYVKINRENAESTLIYAILGAERVIHTFPVLGHKNSDER